MTARTHHPIIIVGGGPAGIAAALHIADAMPSMAQEMLVLEAKHYPRDKVCGGGITVHGNEQLQKLGIELDVPDFTVNQLIFRLGKQAFRVNHEGAMRVYHRYELDHAIAKAAFKRGICIRNGERLLNLCVENGCVYVTTNQAEYTAKVVIGADGANSVVRRKMNFASSETKARLLRVVSPVDAASDELWQRQAAVFDFTCVRSGVQGYTWDFPTFRDGVPHMNRGIFDSGMIPESPHQRDIPHGNLKHTFGDWLAERDVDLDHAPLDGYPVRWFNPHADFAQPHILLTGDAAGVDALFAEGISYAMEYGEVVAATLQDAFSRNDFTFHDYRQRLVTHRMGKLLQRRTAVARAIYRHRFPPFWDVFWWWAKLAPKPMQRAIGAALALLPSS